MAKLPRLNLNLWSSCLNHPKCWDYNCVSLHLVFHWSFDCTRPHTIERHLNFIHKDSRFYLIFWTIQGNFKGIKKCPFKISCWLHQPMWQSCERGFDLPVICITGAQYYQTVSAHPRTLLFLLPLSLAMKVPAVFRRRDPHGRQGLTTGEPWLAKLSVEISFSSASDWLRGESLSCSR